VGSAQPNCLKDALSVLRNLVHMTFSGTLTVSVTTYRKGTLDFLQMPNDFIMSLVIGYGCFDLTFNLLIYLEAAFSITSE
jgi:hypothetical protein